MEEDNCNIQLESLPILVTSDISYCNSMISFQKSVKNGSQNDSQDFNNVNSCIGEQNRSGEFMFSEAVKCDFSLSDNDLKKNAKNMFSLVKVLFEDVGEILDKYEVATVNLTAQQHSDDKISNLFNNTIETGDSDGSLSGQYILNQYQGWKKEALNLLKSWCIFFTEL
jgi:hypothetical protein